jgi:DNA-binding transcriptional ArsR family regulator
MAPTQHDTSPADPGEMDAAETEIDAAILAELASTGHELIRWYPISRRVPGTWAQKTWALRRLYNRGLIYTEKYVGTMYACLADEEDRELAARYLAQGIARPRQLRGGDRYARTRLRGA